jgi:hypothetical protein
MPLNQMHPNIVLGMNQKIRKPVVVIAMNLSHAVSLFQRMRRASPLNSSEVLTHIAIHDSAKSWYHFEKVC